MITKLQDLTDPAELLANAVAHAVANKDRVLVVGTKGDNLPTWMAEHPQVVQWPSQGNEVVRATSLPPNTGLVLFLKWISHTNHKRVCAMADNGCYVHRELLGTGEVRRLLAPLQGRTLETPHPAAPASPPDALPAPSGPRWEGTLYGFVEANYVYGAEHGHQKAEGERLLRLAYKHGLTSTLASVTNTVSTVHRSLARTREEAMLAAIPPPPDVPDLLAKPLDPAVVAHLTTGTLLPPETTHLPEPVVAPTPSVAALVTASATNEAAVDTSLTELLRMLDDAVAVLGLAREQLVGLSSQNAALRTSREALRDKVTALFDGI